MFSLEGGNVEKSNAFMSIARYLSNIGSMCTSCSDCVSDEVSSSRGKSEITKLSNGVYNAQLNDEDRQLQYVVEDDYISQIRSVLQSQGEIDEYRTIDESYIIEVISKTSLSLLTVRNTDIENYEYSVYFPLNNYHRFIKNRNAFNDINRIYVNLEDRKIALQLIDGSYISTLTQNRIIYTMSLLTNYFAFLGHNWIHFHFPDLFVHSFRVFSNPSSTISQFLDPIVKYVSVTNDDGLRFDHYKSSSELLFPDETGGFDMNLFAESVTELTSQYYKTFTLDKLFNIDIHEGNRTYIVMMTRTYRETYNLVSTVLDASSRTNYEEELQPMYMQIVHNITGLSSSPEWCIASDDNIKTLVARFIHQVQFIHSVDHRIFYKIGKLNIECTMYPKVPPSIFIISREDCRLYNSFLQAIVYNKCCPNISEYNYKHNTLNKIFQKYKRAVRPIISAFALHLSTDDIYLDLSDIALSLAY